MFYRMFRRIRTWFDTTNCQHCRRSGSHIFYYSVPYILLQCKWFIGCFTELERGFLLLTANTAVDQGDTYFTAVFHICYFNVPYI